MLKGEALSKAGGGAHQAMCPQGEVENNRGRKGNKSHRERGAKQEWPLPNSHEDPPQSSQLASLQNQAARRGLPLDGQEGQALEELGCWQGNYIKFWAGMARQGTVTRC